MSVWRPPTMQPMTAKLALDALQQGMPIHASKEDWFSLRAILGAQVVVWSVQDRAHMVRHAQSEIARLDDLYGET